MENVLVSIMMPAYNVEPFVGRAIESVLNQTYKNFELVIINDGSKDNTEKVCLDYAQKDDRIKVYSQENHGLAYTRNRGLDLAKGDVFAFLDSDDYIDANFLEYMLALKEKHNAQVAVCDFVKFSNPDECKVSDKEGAVHIWNREEALKNCYGTYGNKIACPMWNKIYDRALFDGIRFPSNLNNEDEFVLPKLLDKTESVVYSEKTLYFYYQNENSVTQNAKYMFSDDIYKVYDDRLDYFKNKDGDYSWFIHLSEKEYLDRIIARYKRVKSKVLSDFYRKKYNEFGGDKFKKTYKLFYCSPRLYCFLTKVLNK